MSWQVLMIFAVIFFLAQIVPPHSRGYYRAKALEKKRRKDLRRLGQRGFQRKYGNEKETGVKAWDEKRT
jgi:hypothetical protein